MPSKYTRITHGSISSYTCPQKYHTYLQCSRRESALTRFHDLRVIIIIFFIFFFFRPAFSLVELVYGLNFSLNVSCDGGGVHRRKAMLVFLPPMATEDYRRTIQLKEDNAIFTVWRSVQTPPTRVMRARANAR